MYALPSSRGRSAAGSASPCQGEGRGFESRRPLEDASRRLAAPTSRCAAACQAAGRGDRISVAPGGVAEWLRQGPAKPCTRVRFPPPPRNNVASGGHIRAISSVGEHYLDTVGVTGSIPVSPTRYRPRIPGPVGASEAFGKVRISGPVRNESARSPRAARATTSNRSATASRSSSNRSA